MARTLQTDEVDVDYAMRFDPSRVRVEEDDVPRRTQISANATCQMRFSTLVREQSSRGHHSTLPFATRTNPTSKDVEEGLGSVGNAHVPEENVSNIPRGGRPPQASRGITMGRYKIPHRGGRGGKNTRGASSSRPPKPPPRGIGAPRVGVDVEPFLETFTPGPTRTTPAYRVHKDVRGPTINSDAEDPAAKRHKKIVQTNRKRGRVGYELRNENSEVEDYLSSQGGDDEEGSGSEDEEADHDCDEAPADSDVCIRDAHRAEGSNREVRRSNRLNTTRTTFVDEADVDPYEDNFST